MSAHAHARALLFVFRALAHPAPPALLFVFRALAHPAPPALPPQFYSNLLTKNVAMGTAKATAPVSEQLSEAAVTEEGAGER